MSTTLGIGILLFSFVGLTIIFYRMFEDWYKPLLLIPLAFSVFLLPVLGNSLMTDSQDCQWLVNESVADGYTHNFDYDYRCNEVSNTTRSIYVNTMRIVITLGSLVLIFWTFSLLWGKSKGGEQ